mmetsp:Transcript_425/g.1545  ORF Transcript_425/g.1545 Transcript_425/m.1545 type:complete len:263 (+) Transcript_425:38-826(+)
MASSSVVPPSSYGGREALDVGALAGVLLFAALVLGSGGEVPGPCDGGFEVARDRVVDGGVVLFPGFTFAANGAEPLREGVAGVEVGVEDPGVVEHSGADVLMLLFPPLLQLLVVSLAGPRHSRLALGVAEADVPGGVDEGDVLRGGDGEGGLVVAVAPEGRPRDVAAEDALHVEEEVLGAVLFQVHQKNAGVDEHRGRFQAEFLDEVVAEGEVRLVPRPLLRAAAGRGDEARRRQLRTVQREDVDAGEDVRVEEEGAPDSEW